LGKFESYGIMIDDINKCLEELWKMLYNSGDIVTIRIKSDYVKTGPESVQVEMYANGEYYDANYASLSQHTLASIAIRLALLESCSLATKRLVLDEPAANLDNIVS